MLCLPLNNFILNHFVILLDATLITYLYLFLTGLRYFLDKVKEIKVFWPFSFNCPLVKGRDNFWKIQGLNNGFNDSRRQIYSGEKKMEMSQLVTYNFVPTLKYIYCTTQLCLGIRSHWGQI